MILVWFRNGYRGRPTSNSLTGVGVILHRSQWPGGLRPLACWDFGFESHGGMDVCPLWVVCVPKATASTYSTAWATYRNMPIVGFEPKQTVFWFESHYRHISLRNPGIWTRASSNVRNTHHSQRTDIHAPGRIRTHNLSGRIPPGHWDWLSIAPIHRKWKLIL